MFKKWGKWHYGENPPEPEVDDEGIYLVAIDDTTWNVRFTDKAWYVGGRKWTDTFTEYVDGVYAWATWPALPPMPREEE